MGDTYVVTSAMMTCTFGMAPSSFVANPARLILLSGKTKGNIMDFQPISNIPPFAMCTTLSNPTVAAATAAAQGVLTPMPCIPVTVAPWAPGNPKVLVQGQPALMKSCQCMCAWGGVIKFTTDGQTPEPPLVIIPPMPPVNTPIPDPLSEEELAELSEEDREKYKKKFEHAGLAGGSDREMAQATKDSAAYYEKQGRPEEAAKVEKASQFYKERADAKEAEAKEAINKEYAEKAAQNKQDKLVGEHRQAVDNTKAKRLAMDEKIREQKKYEQESDAWYKLGEQARHNGNEEQAKKFYQRSFEYDDKAKQAGKEVSAAKGELEQAQAEMHKTYEAAGGAAYFESL